ncbi:MAG: hypothetical protein JSU94_08910 [Phycisphaerales bacterium]|nr:MAG: hypothetical protein JSU94_08910 [Phycisphaerales bacterium]
MNRFTQIQERACAGVSVLRVPAALVVLLWATVTTPGCVNLQGVDLYKGFQNPPQEARPWTYFLLLNGYMNRDYLESELRQLRDVGIGGLCVFDMGGRGDEAALPPAGPAFMSEPWLDNFAHLVDVAGRLGLDVQLAVSSSWDMGATWVKPQDASMALYHTSINVQGPAEFNQALPEPEIPSNAPRDAEGKPIVLESIAVLAFQAAVTASKHQPAGTIASADTVIDLSTQVGADGHLRWSAPKGKWTVLRFVLGNTGERLKVASPNSDGLATDHFSARATADYIDYLTERLRRRLGRLEDTPLKSLYLPSYEVRGNVWTGDLVEQFRHYRGYDPTKWLPVVAGYTIENQEQTERFRYDLNKTLGDLLVDAYYRTATESARRAGLELEAEAGGPGPPVHNVPVDALKALGAITEVRGEFWPWRLENHPLWVVKETACAAHIYGRKRVHMESFTGFYHWAAGPFDLKFSADRAFCEGMNHVVWHTASHQPPEAGNPGWVYGAGTHLTPNLIWFDKAGPFIRYLARTSFMLQQGLFVADVCYYYGDHGFNFVPPKHVGRSPGPGYDYDVTNAEVLLKRMTVRNGRLRLPDGMEYEVLVLPDREDINPDVLAKVLELVKAGATVVGPKPRTAAGLADHAHRDRRVKEMAERLYGDCNGKTVFENQLGKGSVIWGRTVREILKSRGLGPDFQYMSPNGSVELDYIHRRDGHADIYFVRNVKAEPVRTDVTFRVRGRVPELWDPATGTAVDQQVYEQTPRGVRMPLALAEHGSVFVVFRERDAQSASPAVDSEPEVVALPGPWELSFEADYAPPSPMTLDTLMWWTEESDRDIRYFSGLGRYKTTARIPDNWLGDDRQVAIDLGRMWSVAEVFVNGEPAGIIWKPPYRLDITEALKPGPNVLVIEVANTWCNRIIGDALGDGMPPVTRTNITGSGTPKRSWKNIPPHPSGLKGAVQLISTKRLRVRPESL